MTISIEERLRRAAEVLDEQAEDHVASPRYLPDEPRQQRLRGVLAVAAAAVIVGGLVGVVSVERRGDIGVASAPVDSSPGEPGWARLPSAPIGARFEHLAVTTGTGLFVWGGFAGSASKTDGAFYDSRSGEWRELPRSPLAGDRGDAVGAWTGSEVVVLNGIDGAVKAAAFDPEAFEWRALLDPPLTNAANMMVRLLPTDEGVVVIAVGTEGEGGARNEVARYDSGTNRWEIGESPPVSFGSGFDAVSVRDEIVVVGRRGVGGMSCGQSVVLAYRPSMNSWRVLPSGPIAERGDLVVASSGDELLAAGGFMCGDDGPRREAFLLDPATGSWREAAAAPVALSGSDRYAEASDGRQVFAIDETGAPAIYDFALDSWESGPVHPLGPMLTETPWSWVGDAAVAFSGGISSDDGSCCRVVDEGYAYTPGSRAEAGR